MQKLVRSDRVAIYIRWSTDEQAEGTTLDIQRDACRHFLAMHGWLQRDDLTFIDDGYSGGDLQRPDISRLRRLIKRGEVDCVVVYKLDRLSRNIVDAVNLVLHEWDGVCYLKSAMEPIDTSTEFGRMIFSLLAMFADFERSQIRMRMSAGKVRRAREGRYMSSRVPFGYKRAGPGLLEIDEETAPYVREIFQRYVQGAGVLELVRYLERVGVKPPISKRWHPNSIQVMLQNPVYHGQLRYGTLAANPNRGRGGDTRHFVARDTPLVVLEDTIPAIIPYDLFVAANETRVSRRPKKLPPRAATSPYLLSSIVRCRCGRALVARKSRMGPMYYYNCLDQRVQRCDCAYIRGPDLEAAVTQLFLDSVQEPGHQAGWLNIDRSNERAEAKRHQTQIERRIADLAGQERRVRQQYRQAELTVQEMRQLLAEIQEDQQAAREEAAAAAERISALADDGARQAAVRRWLDTAERWEELTTPEKKRLLQMFIERLTVYRPKGEPVEIDLVLRQDLTAIE